VPDQPEASHRVPGQRPYPEPEPYETASPSGSPSSSRLPQRGQRESGLPGWLAVLLLIAIAGASGLIDSISGSAVRGAFNFGLVLASLVAILVVRRTQMFSVVIAPPLVYFVASAGLLYVRTGGLHNRGKLIDAATNWIVYGFPAIAGATAVVLVVAGIRLMARR
jgi:Gpi18-like mannosyltransferase